MEMFEKEQKTKWNVQQSCLLPVQVKVRVNVSVDNPDRMHESMDWQFLSPEAREMALFSEEDYLLFL